MSQREQEQKEQEQRRSDLIDYLLMNINRTNNWDRKREAIQKFAERIVLYGW